MKIFLPINIKPTGGTSSFAKKLQTGLSKHGHEVIFEFQSNYDILLASPKAPLKHLLYAKTHNKPIIQRLDGAFFPGSSAGTLWPLHNLPIRLNLAFADYVIFQSKFSKQQCKAMLWPKFSVSPKQQTTIYNGVDTNTFSPEGKTKELRDQPDQKIIITWSRFRRPDQIDPLITGFLHFRSTQNAKLIIIGNFESQVKNRKNHFSNSPDIDFLGPVPNEELPQYARGADAFLITHRLPPCPNNVIEAMACGLPIAGIADGAMPELVKTGRDGELVASNNITPSTLGTAIRNALTHKPKPHKEFTLEHMLAEYMQVFKTVKDG